MPNLASLYHSGGCVILEGFPVGAERTFVVAAIYLFEESGAGRIVFCAGALPLRINSGWILGGGGSIWRDRLRACARWKHREESAREDSRESRTTRYGRFQPEHFAQSFHERVYRSLKPTVSRRQSRVTKIFLIRDGFSLQERRASGASSSPTTGRNCVIHRKTLAAQAFESQNENRRASAFREPRMSSSFWTNKRVS